MNDAILTKGLLAFAGLACVCRLSAGTPPQPMLAAGNESNWDAYAKALARGVSAGTSARQTPDWLKTGYIYQIQPRAFTHEGTIKAATRKLPLVKDAGATVVYLMPVNVLDDETEHLGAIARQFKQPKGFYRTKDYFNTDPEFGTNEDRREFVREAHRLGMKVIFDIVFFHCGHSAELIKKNPNWVERNPDGSIRIGKWSYPVLNFREAGLREYLYTVLTYLVADVDVDGFRCDVAETQPLDFWVEARRRVSAIKPDAVLICEGFGCPGEQEYAFDACYDWPSKNAIRKSLDGQKPVSDIVRAWHEKHDNCEKGSRFLRFVENHDETDMSQKGKGPRGDSDERWGRELMEAALFYCFTADGIPFLFNGNEFADRTPQRMLIWTPIDWYGRDTPEGVRRLSFVLKFAALRKTDPAFSTDARLDWVTNSCPDAVLTYRKTSADGASKWLCAVNFRKVPVTVKIPGRDPFPLAPAEWKMFDEKSEGVQH